MFVFRRDPRARLQQLAQAGELHIPFTTGVLLGIGEGPNDTETSIRAIADVAQQYGHIQVHYTQQCSSYAKHLLCVPFEPCACSTHRMLERTMISV